MCIALPGVRVGKDEAWGNPGDVLSEVEVGWGLRRSSKRIGLGARGAFFNFLHRPKSYKKSSASKKLALEFVHPHIVLVCFHA